jgi:hypothetical protein
VVIAHNCPSKFIPVPLALKLQWHNFYNHDLASVIDQQLSLPDIGLN